MFCIVFALIVVPAVKMFAGGQGRSWSGYEQVPYNGGFTFTRVRYTGRAWNHDYPNADFHLSKILEYISTIPINVVGTNVYDLDDPEIFRHPIIYLSEPGFWGMTDEEGLALNQYLLKGGFLILDDFEGNQWYNMEAQLRRAMPDHRLIEVGPDHPIFNSFFEVRNIYVPHAMYQLKPSYWALFEDNDPTKRMMVLVNHDSDLAEYWEFSDTGMFPVDMSNEAYKLGVNYIFYALTH